MFNRYFTIMVVFSLSMFANGCSYLIQHNNWIPDNENREWTDVGENGFRYNVASISLNATISAEVDKFGGPPLIPLIPLDLGSKLYSVQLNLQISSRDTVTIDLTKISLYYPLNHRLNPNSWFLKNKVVYIKNEKRDIKLWFDVPSESTDSLSLEIADVQIGNDSIRIPSLNLKRVRELKYYPLSLQGFH